MSTLTLPRPEYIINKKGKKKSVILPIEDYENLIEELQDLADIIERRSEQKKLHSDFISELKTDGYI